MVGPDRQGARRQQRALRAVSRRTTSRRASPRAGSRTSSAGWSKPATCNSRRRASTSSSSSWRITTCTGSTRRKAGRRSTPTASSTRIKRMLKPGGKLLIVDHNAAAGTGKEAASKLHRLNEDWAKKSLTAHGFVFEKILRRPAQQGRPARQDGFRPGGQGQDRSLRAPVPGEVDGASMRATGRVAGGAGSCCAAASACASRPTRPRTSPSSRASRTPGTRPSSRKDEAAIAGNMAEDFRHHRRLRQHRNQAVIRRRHRRSEADHRSVHGRGFRSAPVRRHGAALGPHAHDGQVRRQAVQSNYRYIDIYVRREWRLEDRERADHEDLAGKA